MAARLTYLATSPCGFYHLYELPSEPGATWRNFKLFRVPDVGERPRRRQWPLGWNGSRLASTKAVGSLAERRPDVYDWILRELRGGHE